MSRPTPNGAVTFGIMTAPQQVSYGDILRVWREAETVPEIRHAWLFDHLMPIGGDPNGLTFEGWTLLSALAAQTERLRLGVLVTSNRFRAPAMLAKIATTVDIVSGGRLDFGIGVGSRPNPPSAWREYPAHGLPFHDFADAVGSLAEACTVIRRLWAEPEPFDFDGTYVRLTGAFGNPKPVRCRVRRSSSVDAQRRHCGSSPSMPTCGMSPVATSTTTFGEALFWTNSVRRSAEIRPRSPARSISRFPTTGPPRPNARSRKPSTPASDISSSGSPLRIPKTSRTGSPTSSSIRRELSAVAAPGAGRLERSGEAATGVVMRRSVASGHTHGRTGRSKVVTLLASCATAVAIVCPCAAASGSGSVARETAISSYRLVQYPGAGFGGFYAQIAHAHRSIDMEMYELEDVTAERDLVAAVARGVTVRVLLDKAFSGAKANRSAADYLAAKGVEVKWAPAGYIFHIKTTTFDAQTSDISTANLVSKYYTTTRDAEIIDTDPPQVRAIERTFSNDWTAGASRSPRSQTVQSSGLVWSPNTGSGTAETALVEQITSAHSTVDFESEELSDPAIYQALAADASRGVRCRVVMTRSSEWNSAFAVITKAGCLVHLFPNSSMALYIHEKLILDDAATARESLLIGSQNASTTSLTRNRELGILLTRAGGGGDAIATAGAAFDSDFGHASSWTLPKPKPTPTPTPTPAPTPASCHPKTSSGNCYKPGEYCSNADHGMSGVAGDGEPIVCENNDGWRWEPQ